MMEHLEKISRKGLDVEDRAFDSNSGEQGPGLLMGCELRVSQECSSIAVEQVLAMESSTQSKHEARGMASSAKTRTPGHRALPSRHLDKPECREKEISNTGKEPWKLVF